MGHVAARWNVTGERLRVEEGASRVKCLQPSKRFPKERVRALVERALVKVNDNCQKARCPIPPELCNSLDVLFWRHFGFYLGIIIGPANLDSPEARSGILLSSDCGHSIFYLFNADSSDVDQGFRVKAIRVPAIPIKVGAQRRWRD